MNRDELFQKLTQLLASRIDYDGEFNTLFFIENERGELKINFLNKQHYHYILMNLKDEILKLTGSDIKFGYLNMNTSPISLKSQIQEEPKTIKIKTKEKVELPTIKNKTLKQIEDFLTNEYEKIKKENLEIMAEYEEKDKNLYESIRWSDNWGQITLMGKIYDFLKEIKDYEED